MNVLEKYFGILGLFFVFLTVNVIRHRKISHTSLGEGTNANLQRAIRSHANFAEYVPFFMIIMLCLHTKIHITITHTLCTVFIIGRILHFYGIFIAERKGNFKFRVSGE